MRHDCIAIIPARGGSRGVPGKKIVKLGGRPLIAYTIEQSLKARVIARTVVTTDSPAIARIARALGAEVVRRPARLAGPRAKIIEAVRHVLAVLEQREGYRPAMEVLLQPTNPFRRPGLIDEAIAALTRRPSADALFGVSSVTPKFGSLFRGCYIPSYAEGLRRQDMRPLFRENGSLFIARCETVMAHRSIRGRRIIAFPVDELSAFDIDSLYDLSLARALVRHIPQLRRAASGANT